MVKERLFCKLLERKYICNFKNVLICKYKEL